MKKNRQIAKPWPFPIVGPQQRAAANAILSTSVIQTPPVDCILRLMEHFGGNNNLVGVEKHEHDFLLETFQLVKKYGSKKHLIEHISKVGVSPFLGGDDQIVLLKTIYNRLMPSI